jgi:hypothetical protein
LKNFTMEVRTGVENYVTQAISATAAVSYHPRIHLHGLSV